MQISLFSPYLSLSVILFCSPNCNAIIFYTHHNCCIHRLSLYVFGRHWFGAGRYVKIDYNIISQKLQKVWNEQLLFEIIIIDD